MAIAFKWRKRNTTVAEYVSTYPAGVWLIKRGIGSVWGLYRAGKDGDPYQHIKLFSTLAQAKQAAEDWSPES